MPTANQPPKRRRGLQRQAQLFPRTERHIEAPPCDRALHRDVVHSRRYTAQQLRYVATHDTLDHLRD